LCRRIARRRPRLGGGGAALGAQPLPLARREIEDASRRVGRDAVDHVAQVGEGLDAEVSIGVEN
jgi:hypothetical protein